MGSKSSVIYAIVFMWWLETYKIFRNWKGSPLNMYNRFIDDLFGIWAGTEEELLEFVEHCNNQHSFIKFKANYDIETKSVPFLDTVVSIDQNGYIQTDLYKKPTDTAAYLLPQSCHPGHITKNIPYSLAFRLKRICSQNTSFMAHLKSLNRDLLKRGYTQKILDKAFGRVVKIPRDNTLEKVAKNCKKKEVFALTFHKKLPSISNIIQKHWRVMTEDDTRLKKCFDKPPVVAYRRTKNLSDLLIRAKLPKPRFNEQRKVGFTKCNKTCIACPYTNNSKVHKLLDGSKTFTINNSITCDTANIIYRVTCTKCIDFVYIGETDKKAKDRFLDHKGYVINHDSRYATGEHFNTKGHALCNIMYLPIEKVHGDTLIRKRREKLWIKTYDAKNSGHNKR